MVYFHIEGEVDLKYAVREVERNETQRTTRKRARVHDTSIRKLHINSHEFLNMLVSEEKMSEWACVFPHVENFEIEISIDIADGTARSFAKLVTLLPNLRTLRMWNPSWNLIKYCSDKWQSLDYVDIRFHKDADEFETTKILKFLPTASYVQLQIKRLTAVAGIALDNYLRACPLHRLNIWFGRNIQFPMGFGYGLRDREPLNMYECCVNFTSYAPDYAFIGFFSSISTHVHNHVSFHMNCGYPSATKLFMAVDRMSNTNMRALTIRGNFDEPGAALLSTVVQRNPHLERLAVHGSNTMSDDAEKRLMAVIDMVNQTREKKIEYVEKRYN